MSLETDQLEPSQIVRAIKDAPQRRDAGWDAICHEIGRASEDGQTLTELFASPRYLSTALTAYSGSSPRELLGATSGDASEMIWQKFLSPPDPIRYRKREAREVVEWLTWLATSLHENGQQTFELRDLVHLVDGKTQRQARLLVRLTSGLLVGLISGLVTDLVVGLLFGILVASDPRIFVFHSCPSFRIQRAGTNAPVSLSGSQNSEPRSPIVDSLKNGVLVALVSGVASGLVYFIVSSLVTGSGFGVIFGLLVGLGFGREFGAGAVLVHWFAIQLTARSGNFPRRPGRFLLWCTGTADEVTKSPLDRQWIREAGGVFQFSDPELQVFLTQRATSADSSNGA